MKYIVRAVKYFFYLLILLALVVAVLVLSGLVEGDLGTMFVNGYDSYWQMALVAAALAAIYPRLGYSTHRAHIYGEPADVEDTIQHVMSVRGYVEKDRKDDGRIRFVKASPVSRALKMWEDTITMEICPAWVEIEGSTREVVRIVSGLEAADREKHGGRMQQ